MPTLEEIARLSLVSRSTVSRVINDDPHVSSETREKVLEVVRRLNYQPHAVARSLAAGRTRIIGLVVPAGIVTTFQDPFFPVFVQAMASTCNSRGYSVMLWLSEAENERRSLNQLLSNGLLAGVIISTIHLPDGLAQQLESAGLPFVLIGQHTRPIETHYVDVENRRGAQEIVTHLLRLGYKKIAHICGPMDTVCAQDRRSGYIDALRAREKAVDERLIIEGDFVEPAGYYAMQQLLPLKPDAVFASNDLMAMGAIRAMREVGIRVPRDVGVVGFDDIPSAVSADPPLTTVRQPTHRMGTVITETLIDVIEHNAGFIRRVVLPTELVIRESCGAALKLALDATEANRGSTPVREWIRKG